MQNPGLVRRTAERKQIDRQIEFLFTQPQVQVPAAFTFKRAADRKLALSEGCLQVLGEILPLGRVIGIAAIGRERTVERIAFEAEDKWMHGGGAFHQAISGFEEGCSILAGRRQTWLPCWSVK